jgi:hypothetical protein
MKWEFLLLVEIVAFLFVVYTLRYVKLPRLFAKRQLSARFPWGYYADQIPSNQQGYIQDKAKLDFMYDLGTEFAGPEGFGDYGEFSGFGELGEYGATFFSGE